MQVVDVRRVDETVHGGVDRRRRAALAVQRVVEGCDHLVLAVDAGVDLRKRTQAIEPQHCEARLGERSEVSAGSLHPEQLDGLARDPVDVGALRRRVAAGIVGDPRVGAQTVASGDQVAGGGHHAPQLACWPPTRSFAIFFW